MSLQNHKSHVARHRSARWRYWAWHNQTHKSTSRTSTTTNHRGYSSRKVRRALNSKTRAAAQQHDYKIGELVDYQWFRPIKDSSGWRSPAKVTYNTEVNRSSITIRHQREIASGMQIAEHMQAFNFLYLPNQQEWWYLIGTFETKHSFGLEQHFNGTRLVFELLKEGRAEAGQSFQWVPQEKQSLNLYRGHNVYESL